MLKSVPTAAACTALQLAQRAARSGSSCCSSGAARGSRSVQERGRRAAQGGSAVGGPGAAAHGGSG